MPKKFLYNAIAVKYYVGDLVEYLAVWKILDQAIADFRKKGADIPEKIMDDLKSARTLMNILKSDPCREETALKIEIYLANVESFLVSEGQKRFGNDYADNLLKRVNSASRKLHTDEKEERFIPGLPRGHNWVRIMPTAELNAERIKETADDMHLSCKTQEDGHLLVYGKDECVKEFVKKMATAYGLESKK
ncbi:DUF2096 family protein [Candidatus Bathyarchaeota archaeon]|nr:DUF2096 family protein [Candidatus Bathyarchaeota archaeon]